MDCFSLGRLVEVRLLAKIILIFLFGLNTSWADTWISIGGGTYHTCETCGYNGVNPGLGIQTDYSKDLRFVAGGYYNSYYKASFYGGGAWQPIQYEIIKVGIVGGVISNYNNLRVPLMALPVISIEGERLGIDIMGIPTITNHSGIITANLKFKL